MKQLVEKNLRIALITHLQVMGQMLCSSQVIITKDRHKSQEMNLIQETIEVMHT